ncbi:MAG: hypoxanthine phosphoribosyltransferase [Lachnospiraceae bacterium]|nr:hypoxanthine phosphoribosyltransferase [Lachnospiraceae bacterium]
MADRIDVLFDEEKIVSRVKELGKQISEDYKDKEVTIICILKGASFFACELAKRITVPVYFDFMKVSSYGNETESSGVVKIVQDLDEPIRGKNVIVVEDIIDSGRTMHYLFDILRSRGPESVKLCALLDKPDRRVTEVDIDYTGFVIPDKFVVGYGLDYAQKYRNLPYIGVVTLDENN